MAPSQRGRSVFGPEESALDNGLDLGTSIGLQKLQPAMLMKVLKLKEPVDEPNPFTAQIKDWKNNELHVSVGWGRDEQSAVVAWDLPEHRWRMVSREAPAKG